MTSAPAKSAPRCAVCGGTTPPFIKSDLGAVCRDCKGHIVRAEVALSEAEIPPASSTSTIPNN